MTAAVLKIQIIGIMTLGILPDGCYEDKDITDAEKIATLQLQAFVNQVCKEQREKCYEAMISASPLTGTTIIDATKPDGL